MKETIEKLKELYTEMNIIISDEELYSLAYKMSTKHKNIEPENSVVVEISIKDFFKLNNANNDMFIDTPITLLEDFFIETPNNKSRINHIIKKEKEKLIVITFSNNQTITVARKHLFPQLDGIDIYAEDAKYVIKNGSKLFIKNKVEKDILEDIYDVGIEYPNLFSDSTGILHHNSALMASIAANMVVDKKSVLYITLELSEEEVMKRVDANILNVNLNHFKELSANEIENKFEKIKDNIGEIVVKEYGAGTFNVLHLGGLLNDLLNQENPFIPDVIFIDYLGIASSSRISLAKAGGSYGYVKAIAEEFHAFAKKYDLPVISASQLNRCLSGDTLIDKLVDSNYIETPIKDINVGDVIRTHESNTKVIKHIKTNKQKVFLIKLKSGKIIKVSKDHRFPTSNGLLSINTGLKVGMNIHSNINNKR